MTCIDVCPLSRLQETARETGARSLITLLSPGGVEALRPATIDASHHLVMGISDIVAPRDGHTHPEATHVERIVGFLRAWDRAAPMLIHCYAGVSRSTAAAYIGLCCLAPDRSEREIARTLRAASPTATPNARLVALADQALGRSGRMVEAIAAIGRGVDCFEGEPFGLELAASVATACDP